MVPVAVLGFKRMHPPSIAALPAPLARSVRLVARTLERAGRRAWLVGGAVRDLALGIEPKDADLATPATPPEIEALFERTYLVGKAFGTVVVRAEGNDLQVTTFRTEADYRDGRRPGEVRFGTSLEQDAARRDFTCNALFLDPLTDEFVDPTGGLADLDARRLRCVGHPEQRFSEDGLRLLRLARIAANFGLEIEPETRAAAGRSLASLRGVSAERVFSELERLAAGPSPGRGTALLAELGILERVLPGLSALGSPGEGPNLARRTVAVAELGPRCLTRRFLGTLCRPAAQVDLEQATGCLRALRAPRVTVEAIERTWKLEPELEGCLQQLEGAAPRRSRWVRLVRAEEFADTLAVWLAWHPGERVAALEELQRRASALSSADRFPELLLNSADLARAGIPRGPLWSVLLREAEDLQLDGELVDRQAASAWLERRASRA